MPQRLLLWANCVLPVFLIATGFGITWLVVLTACVHVLLLYAILHPRCSWLCPLRSTFSTSRKAVWLTIDDGPHPEHTPDLARALQKRGVSATFFLVGEKLTKSPGIITTLIENGHSVGLHTQTHPRWTFWCAGESRIRQEIEGNLSLFEKAGYSPRWFRSPVGHKPPKLASVLKKLNLQLLGWSVSARDGLRIANNSDLLRIQKLAAPGSIILIHEGSQQHNRAILDLVDALLGKGFLFDDSVARN